MNSRSLTLCTVCAALFLRVLVGYQPHSGMENHHGSKTAYGGDYEAQRHWMELTWHLPIGDWYWYDLQYWGLDYPPLTAYVSYVCGALSDFIVGPETVALELSRGYEDPTHKSFMRASVWMLDLLVYFPAAFCILKVLWQSKQQNSRQQDFDATFFLSLVQPAIVLIDHGHFQYNTVALGLALWSFYFMTHPNFYSNAIWGSIFFSCALNFKQMTLYYAPAIFAYLLGRCFAPFSTESPKQKQPWQECVKRFVALGGTVIVVFVILWLPFLVNGPTNEDISDLGAVGSILQRAKHVLHRIFPLERGLFEGKVANLWCAFDTKPVNIRDRIPTKFQPLAALALTFALMLPSCVVLFVIGKKSEKKHGTAHQQASDLVALLWGSASCALAFFLASFQVHEKSILLALAPASLLPWQDALFCDWFAVVAAWTMWPLLAVDRLQIAYTCIVTIFGVLISQFRAASPADRSPISWFAWGWSFLCKLSLVAMLSLHFLEMVIEVPSNLPDLFPVLWSVGGCALCCLAWAKTTVSLATLFASEVKEKTKND